VISLVGFLRRHRRIALDTNVFIYHLEANPTYSLLTGEIFTWIERGGHSAVTSTITMTELLGAPYRELDQAQVNSFYGLLTTFPNLDWTPLRLSIADKAAQIRAVHRLRTPDAVQAATAIAEQATGFVTNDPVFRRVSDFETLLLDDVA